MTISSFGADGDTLIDDLKFYRHNLLPQVSTMTCLRARLFGGFVLSDSKGAELKLSTRKTRALLAFLIVEADRWHTRERLAGLLWSDRQQAQARHSLTQALSTIRKLGEASGEQLIESDSERVRLLAKAVDADILSFREAAANDPGTAAQAYAGPLLDNFVAPDEAFDEWVRAERASCHATAYSALHSLADQAEGSSDFRGAISAAERILALDPLAETAHRQLMRLHATIGNRSEAIRQFELCERLLGDELGVTPSAETRALVETIRSTDTPSISPLAERSPADVDSEDGPAKMHLDRPSIAVLPFESLSPDREHDYFADGMAEDLITVLSRFRSLTVIPRNSTFSYKNQAPDLQRVKHELGARYVIEGSVRRAGNCIRISAQLIDADSDAHLWTDRFDRNVDDIFAVQDEVTDGIISAIAPEIDKVERRRAQRRPPENLDAWSLYQRGLTEYHASTKEGLEAAIGHLDKVCEIDPDFAPAFAFAADARLRLVLHFSGDRDTRLSEAAQKSRVAVALDNRDPDCLLADARVNSFLGHYETAIASAREALSLNPSSPMCHYALGFVLGRAGRADEAIPHIEDAVHLGPRDIFLPGYLSYGSIMLFDVGRYEEALEWARRSYLSTNPRSISFHIAVAALTRLGRREEAQRTLSNLLLHTTGPKTLEAFQEFLNCNWPQSMVRNQRLVDALREGGLPESDPHSPTTRPSIAVIPFDNLSKDAEQEVLSDGIADEIINGLSRFRSLLVIARRSTFTYKDRNKDISEIADELGVRYVVEGGVRRSGDRIRITAQLIDTESGHHIWSDRFDRTLDDVFAVQDEVSETIIHEIAPEIGQAEIARARRKPPGSLDAWSVYQRGLSLHPSGAVEDFDAAIALFDQAHAIDPNFADALAMAAYMRLRKVYYFGDVEDATILNEARQLLAKAMRLDPSNSICHAATCRLHILCDEYELAEAASRKAIELNPNSVIAHVELAASLTVRKRSEEALKQWDTITSLSPTDPHMAALHAGRARCLFQLGRFEDCAAQARIASSSPNPRYWADAYLVAALAMMGRTSEAEAARVTLFKRKPDFTIATLKQSRGLDWSDMAEALRKAGISETSATLPLPDRPSIAVLPFANLSGDPEQEYFADGMAEDIITGLSKFHWLFVIARNSSFAYKGKSPDARDVAHDLGVRYILEGSVRRGGARIRISAQLIDAETGSYIWAERYDRELADIFAVQDEVTAAIVSTVAPEIGQSEIDRVRRRPPESLDAWALFQQGMALYPSGAARDFQTAIALFDRARKLDPGFVEALVMAGHMRTRYAHFFKTDDHDDLLEEAQDLLQTAMRLDPSDATSRMALGRWYVIKGDPETGVEYCHEAVALNPNSVLAHFELGIALSTAGRYEEALTHYDTARRLSPRDLHAAALSTGPSLALFYLGRYEEAATNAARASRSPNPRYWADAVLVAALLKLGLKEEAEEAKAVLLKRKPDFRISEFGTAGRGGEDLLSALREAGLPE